MWLPRPWLRRGATSKGTKVQNLNGSIRDPAIAAARLARAHVRARRMLAAHRDDPGLTIELLRVAREARDLERQANQLAAARRVLDELTRGSDLSGPVLPSQRKLSNAIDRAADALDTRGK